MAAKPDATLTMKLLVDTKAGRVLYAEASKEVVDFLFSLLAFPLGAVTKLLTSGAMVGSVGNLYGSVENLDAGYVVRRDATTALLDSPVLQLVAAPAAEPAAPAPAPTNGLYRCKGCSCSASCYNHVTKVSGTPCPVCKGKMTTEVKLVEPDGESSGGAKTVTPPPAADAGSSKGYVRDMVTYTVMDDLSVAPMSTISAVTALVALGVTDISGLQAKTVEIGYKEVVSHLEPPWIVETRYPCAPRPGSGAVWRPLSVPRRLVGLPRRCAPSAHRPPA
ncbi:hypothetical protein ACP70R_031142 [Stipagrostis hirtigluma subsp. patula]